MYLFFSFCLHRVVDDLINFKVWFHLPACIHHVYPYKNIKDVQDSDNTNTS